MDVFGSDFHGGYQIYLLPMKINDMDFEGYSLFTKAEHLFDVCWFSIAVFVSEVCLSSEFFSILVSPIVPISLFYQSQFCLCFFGFVFFIKFYQIWLVVAIDNILATECICFHQKILNNYININTEQIRFIIVQIYMTRSHRDIVIYNGMWFTMAYCFN